MTKLSAESISFAFRRADPVIRDLSLQLRPAELLVLLGGNGSGKTTLLRLLAGHLLAGSGRVLLDEQPIRFWSKSEIAKRLTLMPQFERSEAELSVRDMVQLGRAVHRGWWMPFTDEDHRAVDESLEMTGMTEFQDRSITTLSGGQWRRAILARSLAQNSSILLLDEPTSGLDLRHQFECLDQLRRLVKKNRLIAVISLHDLNQAAMFADRIALVAEQRIVAIDDPENVLTEELIERAYGVRVIVTRHPVSNTPLVVPTGKGMT